MSGRRLLPYMACVLLAGCAAAHRPLQLLDGPGPVYPADARAAGIEGEVEVEYRVDREGRVHDVQVVRADPAGTFDAAAVAAVSRWRYLPARQDGQPVPSERVRSTVRFRLGGAERWSGYGAP